jgi:hypothetical protein
VIAADSITYFVEDAAKRGQRTPHSLQLKGGMLTKPLPQLRGSSQPQLPLFQTLIDKRLARSLSPPRHPPLRTERSRPYYALLTRHPSRSSHSSSNGRTGSSTTSSSLAPPPPATAPTG